MNSSRFLVSIALATGLFGCGTVKVYPICFYDKKPAIAIVDKDFLPGLKRTFAEASSRRADEVVVSPDVRWIVARTTKEQDATLLRIWPRVGCIGPGRSMSQIELQHHCIVYVEDFIKSRKYTQLGEFDGGSGNRYWSESRDPKRLIYCAADN